ncbi:MAG: hypothetical protein RBQ66_00390 [Candidatus Cloacimonadaceae bacterium]|jgi:hypothetical protein|nr:hypothetical protein [Candidatus Cloacimonadaceae bacterium]
MKRYYLIVMLIILFFQMSAKHSDEFTLGTYSYVRNTSSFMLKYREELCSYMQTLGYNASIIETGITDNDLDGLLEIMDRYGIDAWITDNGYSEDPANNAHYACMPLAVSSYYKFEAEYLDERDVNPKDSMNNLFWYASRNDDQFTRVGKAVKTSGASNGFVWKSERGKDQAGYAYGDIRYRWPDTKGQYPLFGEEFFVLQKSSKGYEEDYFWINYRFRLSDIDPATKDTDPLLTFNLSGLHTASGVSERQRVNLKAASQKGDGKDIVFTLNDLNNANTQDGFVDFVIKLSYSELIQNNLFDAPKDFFFVLQNLSPKVYWHGNATLELDFIEIEDQISHELKNTDSAFREGIVRRARELMDNPHGNVSGLYAFDEPYLGLFNSYDIIEETLWKEGIAMMTAIYDKNYGRIQRDKDKQIYYDHTEAFIEATQPWIFAPDIYPIRYEISYNPDSEHYVFVQDAIDNKMLKIYEVGVKYRDQDPRRKFFPIVQAFGHWIKGKPDTWWTLQQPPYAMQKAILYLPLVYKPDGIFHYIVQARHDAEGYGDYTGVISPMVDGKQQNPEPVLDSHTWNAHMHTNFKVYKYGKIIRDLEWLDAQRIMTTAHTSGIPKATFIKKLQVLPQSDAPYDGYVQCGFYSDGDENPYLMIVNRRGNYFKPGKHTLERYVHSDLYDEYFPQADPQTLVIELDKKVSRRFGDYVGFLDPNDNSIIISHNNQVQIELPAGEGNLFKMVQTLPPVIKRKITLKGDTVIAQDVILEKGAKLKLHKNASLTIMPGVQVVAAPESDFNIDGKIHMLDGSKLSIQGYLKEGKKSTLIMEENAELIKTPQRKPSFLKRLLCIE